jgi:uncharacterized sporulation protein YeaH/YhbH (DUF444 family)
MSRKQSRGTPGEIEKQRAIVQAARRELLLDQRSAALAAGAHELTEEQRTQIRHVLRDSTVRLNEWPTRLRLRLNPIDRQRDISRERFPRTLTSESG